MSAADLHDLELIWPSLGPKNVIVTGTFDKWSSSIHLAKGDGGFFGMVKVPWGQKIKYKYIVDGRWQCRDDRPQEDDGHGNINNVLLTPEKPSLPALTIPHEEQSDIEAMVTAVEFTTPAESTAIKGLLPIPQINVDLSKTPKVTEARLDSATATEGNVTPSVTVPAPRRPSTTSIVPVNDSSSVSLSSVDGNGEAQTDPHGFSTHAPIQFTKRGTPTPSMIEAAPDIVTAPPGPVTKPEPSRSSQGVSAPDASPTAVVEPPAKQPETQQSTAPASTDQVSTSTLPPSTHGHKKRPSLLARIRHIIDKGLQERKDRKRKNTN